MEELLGLKEATGRLNNGIADLLANPYIGYIGLNEDEFQELSQKNQELQLFQAIENKKKYAIMVGSHRKEKGVTPITRDLIVNSLKYIAQNPFSSQEDLVQGLLDLGCNFYGTDILKTFGDNPNYFLFNAANIIIDIRDSELARAVYAKRFLTEDTYNSIFQLIRFITHDESYTKENLGLSSNARRKMTP